MSNIFTTEQENYFYIISYPRSGNTWAVNSLKDYLGAQRAEVMPSVYGGDVVNINEQTAIKLAGSFDPQLPIGIKSHLFFGDFNKAGLPVNKALYLLRDGRDVMVSYYFYLNGFLQKNVEKANNFDPDDFTEHLKLRLPEYKNHVMGWKGFRGKILVIKFEELKLKYIETLEKTKNFLNLNPINTPQAVKDRYVDNFQSIDNFSNVLQGNNMDFYRKGVMGDWLNYLNDEHKKIIKSQIGGLLVDLGYEQNLSW